MIVKKVEKNKNVFDEMIAERDAELMKLKAIKRVVTDMMNRNINIDSSHQVKKMVLDSTGH